MNLASRALTIDPAKLSTINTIHCLNYLNMEDSPFQADLPGKHWLILGKWSRSLRFYHGFCEAYSNCDLSCDFTKEAVSVIYVDNVSLMTNFKFITFQLFLVFQSTDVSTDNSYMHTLSLLMI